MEYNNNLFSPSGKLNRLFYILHNGFWNLLGFRFIYYPVIMENLHKSSDFPILISTLGSNPQTRDLVPYLNDRPKDIFLFIILKYVFMLILRLVDIKRMRDILGRELKSAEQVTIAVLFSLPYVDFFSTVFLSVIKSNKFHKSDVAKKMVTEIKKADMQSAQVEKYLETNKRLFEAGKISRAEYEAAVKKYKKH